MRDGDLATLRLFREDYPMAHAFLFYGGTRAYEIDGVRIVPLSSVLPRFPELLRDPRSR